MYVSSSEKLNSVGAREDRQVRARRDAQGRVDGVELAVNMNNLRQQSRMEKVATRNVYGRQCLEVGGVWIDEGFTADLKTVVVKAQSDAYFKILEKKRQKVV